MDLPCFYVDLLRLFAFVLARSPADGAAGTGTTLVCCDRRRWRLCIFLALAGLTGCSATAAVAATACAAALRLGRARALGHENGRQVLARVRGHRCKLDGY